MAIIIAAEYREQLHQKLDAILNGLPAEVKEMTKAEEVLEEGAA
jgi:hypothetical protein